MHNLKRSTRAGSPVGIVNDGKINLEVRQLAFESELRSMKLPKKLETAIGFMLQTRKDGLENRYNQVFGYQWLKRFGNFGSFWKDFGCATLDIWLAKLDLPAGQTLADRAVMVDFFTKETFLLVGDYALSEMMREVSRHVETTKERQDAYAEIFKHYCKQYDVFDKTLFLKTAHWYVETYIVRPRIKQTDAANKAQPVPARSIRKVASTAIDAHEDTYSEAGKEAPLPKSDYKIEQKTCGGCSSRDVALDLAKRHIQYLENFIALHVGKNKIPSRPAPLRDDARAV